MHACIHTCIHTHTHTYTYTHTPSQVRLRRYFVQSKTLHKDKYFKEVLEMMSPGLKGAFSSLLYKESFQKVYFFKFVGWPFGHV